MVSAKETFVKRLAISNVQRNTEEGFRLELFFLSEGEGVLNAVSGIRGEQWLENGGEPFNQLLLGRAGHG